MRKIKTIFVLGIPKVHSATKIWKSLKEISAMGILNVFRKGQKSVGEGVKTPPPGPGTVILGPTLNPGINANFYLHKIGFRY